MKPIDRLQSFIHYLHRELEEANNEWLVNLEKADVEEVINFLTELLQFYKKEGK